MSGLSSVYDNADLFGYIIFGTKPLEKGPSLTGVATALKVVGVIIGMLAATGAIAFGGAGLLHSYAHVSLQLLGQQLGSWIEMVGNILPYTLGLGGIAAIGVAGVAAAIVGSAAIHYARKPQLTDELLQEFTGSGSAAYLKDSDGEPLDYDKKPVKNIKNIPRGKFDVLYPQGGGMRVILKTNALFSKLMYKDCTGEEGPTFEKKLEEAHFPNIKDWT